jgi:NSS family neurotransmitter:Na+ symporter
MSAVELAIARRDGTAAAAAARGRWSSRFSFVLAAAGSAVGLGSIWKFPYITGANGGGWFVAVYLACIVAVAMPIMLAEILLGRATQRSPVGAFRALGGRRWAGVGWLAIVAGFLILSYYFVVSGWTLHYAYLASTGQLFGRPGAAAFADLFAHVYSSPRVNLSWQGAFIALTIGVVLAGVQKGIERCCRVLVPLLLLMLIALVVQAAREADFARGLQFVFGLRAADLTAAAVLEALGHSFFTLSLGMGAMITYGSYLSGRDDAVAATAAVAGFDTFVSLLACVSIFPIILAFGLAPDAGPGLVFVSLPIAFAEMPGGELWATLFFGLLAIAALSSTVSVFEVIVSHLGDERRIERLPASLIAGAALFVVGVPSALSGGTALFGNEFAALTERALGTGRNWFDFVDHVASNWLLPLSGLGIALFFAWRVGAEARARAFAAGTRFGKLYWGWVWALRYLAIPAVIAVFLHAIGML